MSVKVRSALNYDADQASVDTGLSCKDPSLAIQSQAEEADINVIVKRFGITGEIPVTQRVPFPLNVDFDEILDFRMAQDLMLQAQRSFESLPAHVRATFNHDPVAFADYASAPENLSQLREWGLAPKPPLEPESPAPGG